MLQAADIENRDFLVVVHGYHKAEVRTFLAEVAAMYAGVIAKLEERDDSTDDVDRIATTMTRILRAAKKSADDITAHATAAADAIVAEARLAAERLRSEAQASLDDARIEAARVASGAGRSVSTEVTDEIGHAIRSRLDEVEYREAAMRTRLREVGEELQLARLALEGEIALDLRDAEVGIGDIPCSMPQLGDVRLGP